MSEVLHIPNQLLEVDNFSHKICQVLSFPLFFMRREHENEATYTQPRAQWMMTQTTCDAPGVQGICVPMMSSSNLEGCVKLSMATPPSSMSAVVSFRWEVTGWEEVTSLDGRNGREGIRSKGHFYIWLTKMFDLLSQDLPVCMQPIQMVNSRQTATHLIITSTHSGSNLLVAKQQPYNELWWFHHGIHLFRTCLIHMSVICIFLLIIRCFTKNRVNNPKSTSSRQDSVSS